jgi:hypothetical protein
VRVSGVATPNFFVVGAPKAGTTSLYHYLDQHPSVYMSPIKEPCFFAPEAVTLTSRARELLIDDAPALQAYLDGPVREKRERGIVLEWEQYLKLFKNVRNETAVGEASVSYLSSNVAPRLIRARVPHARIVMMLRDPVDRLFSHFSAAQAAGQARGSFTSWVAEQVRADRARATPAGPVQPGRYGRHLQRYLDCFSREQVRVYLYEDYVRAPRTVLQDLLLFLGVEPDYQVDGRDRDNLPGWRTAYRRLVDWFRPAGAWSFPQRRAGRPSVQERAQVIDIYADDIRALQMLLARDLSRWLDPNR